MKVVAILQNQWFKDPARVRQYLATYPQHREAFLARTLFMGCLTGRRLMKVFGSEWCNKIVWEEASPMIGGHSGSVFPADVEHCKAVLAKHEPKVVLAFGKLAESAVENSWNGPVILSPHPAARGADVLPQLARARQALDEMERGLTIRQVMLKRIQESEQAALLLAEDDPSKAEFARLTINECKRLRAKLPPEEQS